MREVLRRLIGLVLFASVTIALAVPNTVSAAERHRAASRHRTTGLGIVFGEPTGLTGKFWQSSNTAIDAGLTYSFQDFVLLYGDYLWHFSSLLQRKDGNGDLLPYLGIGGVLLISSESNRVDRKFFTENGASVGFGARIPLGLEWLPRSVPIGVFAELVPGIGLIPSVFGFLEGGIGVRYYF